MIKRLAFALFLLTLTGYVFWGAAVAVEESEAVDKRAQEIQQRLERLEQLQYENELSIKTLAMIVYELHSDKGE